MLLAVPAILLLLGSPEAAPAPGRPRTEAAAPALAEIEKAASLLDAKRSRSPEAVLERLARIADVDRSGEATLEEAAELRKTVEFGLRLSPLVQRKMDPARQEKVLGVTHEEMEARSKSYRKIAFALNGLVAVPSIDAGASATGRPGPGLAP